MAKAPHSRREDTREADRGPGMFLEKRDQLASIEGQ